MCGKACCVLASNHTRAGTVPDRRGRCGMNRGVAWPVVFRSVNAGRGSEGQVTEGPVYQPSSCRHGAGSTPAAWDGSRQGPVGCGSLRSVGTRSNGAGQGCVRLVGARYHNRHRGRRGEASTPRGGMSLGQVGHVMAGQVCGMSRLGFFALVIGTEPLRRGGAEWKGLKDGS